MNTSNTNFNISLSIEHRSNHIFFYKIKIPRSNLLNIWSNLIPGKRKHYSKLYLNLLKKKVKNRKSNWILKKKESFSIFKNNLYLDKNRPVFKQELKPKLRQFKEMYLKGYTPQEEKILIFKTKKQNLSIKPELLKVNNNQVQINFFKFSKIKLPKYKLVKRPVKPKTLKSSLRAKSLKGLFLEKKFKPFTLLSSSLKVKVNKGKLELLPSLKSKSKLSTTKAKFAKETKQKPLLPSLIKVKDKPLFLLSVKEKKTKAVPSAKAKERKIVLVAKRVVKKATKDQKKTAKTGERKTKPLQPLSIKVKSKKVKALPSLFKSVKKKDKLNDRIKRSKPSGSKPQGLEKLSKDSKEKLNHLASEIDTEKKENTKSIKTIEKQQQQTKLKAFNPKAP